MKVQFRVLYREFLFRIVDLELLAPQGDISKLLGQFVALLIVVSIGLTIIGVGMAAVIQSIPDQSPLVSWAVEHLLVSTTMLVVGLFAVLSWDSLFPDRRDVLVLAPLPLRARTLFVAKVAAVATSLGLTIVFLNSLTGVDGRTSAIRRGHSARRGRCHAVDARSRYAHRAGARRRHGGRH